MIICLIEALLLIAIFFIPLLYALLIFLTEPLCKFSNYDLEINWGVNHLEHMFQFSRDAVFAFAEPTFYQITHIFYLVAC